MPISVQCDSCSAKLKVRDELAGKRVKCPKCSQPLTIPVAVERKPTRTMGAVPTSPVASDPDEYRLAPALNPMLDLLDEAGVESAARGRVCSSCGSDLSALAIICIECGFNNETGKQLETTTYRDSNSSGKSDVEKMLAKAEKEIDEMPISAKEQDFGDGADAFLITGIAVVAALILAGIGVGTIFVMDRIGENINTPMISFFGSIGIYAFCSIWITIVAFKAKPLHGLGCLLTAGVYCIIFGFMQGKALLLPTLICVFAIIIGAVSFAFSGQSL